MQFDYIRIGKVYLLYIDYSVIEKKEELLS